MTRFWIVLISFIAYSSVAVACKPYRSIEVLFEQGDYLVTAANSGDLEKTLAHFQPIDKAQINGIIVLGFANIDDHQNQNGREMISIRRALAVKDWLVDHGLPYDKVYIEGKGSKRAEREGSNFQHRKVEVDFEIIPYPNPCARRFDVPREVR